MCETDLEKVLIQNVFRDDSSWLLDIEDYLNETFHFPPNLLKCLIKTIESYYGGVIRETRLEKIKKLKFWIKERTGDILLNELLRELPILTDIILCSTYAAEIFKSLRENNEDFFWIL